MEKAYGPPPVIGYTVSIEEMQTDFEVYKMLYQATGNGTRMTPEQIARYHALIEAFRE